VELTPSDGMLLAASRFAPLGLSERVGKEIDNGLLYAIGVFLVLGYLFTNPDGGGPLVWSLGAALALGLLAAFVWKRFVHPDRSLLGNIHERKLEHTMFAAALLANEQQGILKLAPDGIELRAEPAGAVSRWPAESLEQGLLRGRALPVSELVSDWRAAYPLALMQLVQSAGRRGLLQANPSRTGPLWIPCAAALAALDPEPTAKLLDDCRLRRPEIWDALQSDIETGCHRAAAAPNLRFEAGAMPDSISVAELEERQQIYKISEDAIRLGSISAAVVWIPAIALYALLPHPLLSYTPPHWPAIVAAAVAAAVLFFERGYRPAEPRPETGMSEEEAALVRERSLSQRQPTWRESLTNAAVTSGIVCWLGLLLCLIEYPIGHVIFTVLVIALAVLIVRRIRLGRLPSAREVALAVARRSRELTAAYKAEPDTDDVAAPPSVSAAGPAAARPLLEVSARDLPPPTAIAQARTDRRRRAALFLLRRSSIAFALLVAGAALLTGIFWLRFGYNPWGMIFVAIVPVLTLVIGATKAVDAWYRLRPAALQRDASLVGRAMRTAARMSPVGQDTLRDLLAAEPEFWRDEELNVSSPLGRALAVCLRYWLFFVAVAFLIVPIFHARALEGLAFTAAGLALAAAYIAYMRTAPAAMARQVKFEPGVRLLMLRVFGSPSFDELISLVKPWLLVGPISHLEGYDSIVRSSEAREKLAEGRLDEVLIKTPGELAAKMAAESTAVGGDLRYRRTAFQCTDAVWKIAIQQMLDRSDVVVMDLSNLGPANLGCAYELGLLLNRVKLPRVLLLVSETTDRECLRTILEHAATRLAPDSLNRDDPEEPWRLLRIGGSTAAQPEESYLDWVRRLDNRIDPMELVSHLLDMALAAPRPAKDHASIRQP
jgi:hypothetical protein